MWCKLLIFKPQTAVRQASDTSSLNCINNADFDQAGNDMHLSTFYYEFIRGGRGEKDRTKRTDTPPSMLCIVIVSLWADARWLWRIAVDVVDQDHGHWDEEVDRERGAGLHDGLVDVSPDELFNKFLKLLKSFFFHTQCLCCWSLRGTFYGSWHP